MADAAVAREMNYVTKTREATRKLWAALLELKALQPEWNSQDYSTNLGPQCFGVGTEHEGLTAAMIGAVVFDTANAVETLMQTGHATNVTNII